MHYVDSNVVGYTMLLTSFYLRTLLFSIKLLTFYLGFFLLNQMEKVLNLNSVN